MKKIFIAQIVTVVVALFTAIFVSIGFFQENREEEIEREKGAKWLERMYVENNLYESLHNDRQILDIPELQFDSPVFVCYYSAMTCQSCVDYAKSKVTEHLLNDNDGLRVFFIASGFNDKVRFNERNTIRWNRKGHILPIGESNSVCYFVLWNKTVFHTFIPESKFGNYTDIYLKEIKKRYFLNIPK